MDSARKPAFERGGPPQLCTPVIISVPHAGRDYPAELADYSAYSSDDLILLEDRHADLLVEQAKDAGHMVIMARTPRAWIDLNRDETDVDPAMIYPQPRSNRALSAKVRGGLGLVPRRTASLGELWRRSLSAHELAHRIQTIHRPYHAAIAAVMDDAVRIFGSAILIDLHSMPPLQPNHIEPPPQIVIGDRFGRSCHGRFASHAARIANDAGFRVGFNVPYAGGHILDAHGQPARDRHAIQIEVDRSLYLDPDMRDPGPGLYPMQSFIAALARTLADEITRPDISIAAE
jgi:N-formylglutamate amidohydrolase